MSIVTLDQINAYALHYGIDLTDGSQYPGVVGSLTTWEVGQGEIDAKLIEEAPEMWKPLVDEYTKMALGKNQEGDRKE